MGCGRERESLNTLSYYSSHLDRVLKGRKKYKYDVGAAMYADDVMGANGKGTSDTMPTKYLTISNPLYTSEP